MRMASEITKTPMIIFHVPADYDNDGTCNVLDPWKEMKLKIRLIIVKKWTIFR